MDLLLKQIKEKWLGPDPHEYRESREKVHDPLRARVLNLTCDFDHLLDLSLVPLRLFMLVGLQLLHLFLR